MQSGISASQELHGAFQTLLSDSSQRGLIVTISTSSETLIPGAFVPSTSPSLSADLSNLTAHLTSTSAFYVLLREDSKCHAVTYVPDAAPVRQKTLVASTRLTLVRELGAERFVSALFATSPADLSPDGWAAHAAHGALAPPLTREEQELEGIRAAEAAESTGTSARRALVGGGAKGASSGVSLPLAADAVEALAALGRGEAALVQLQIDAPSETIALASTHPPPLPPTALASTIAASAPRYSFYAYPGDAGAASKVLFVYTCPPSGARVKERMLYASSRSGVVSAAERDAGVVVAGKMEAGDAEEVSAERVEEEMGGRGGDALQEATAGGKVAGSGGRGFERPKRPGRR